MIARILPADVAAEHVAGSTPVAPPLPAEVDALGPVGALRRRDFAAGRHCAHRALARLGIPTTPLLAGPDRAPQWPTGVVGSITHCAGYAATAVAERCRYAAVGIDAEVAAPLPSRVYERIARPEERAWIALADPTAHLDRLVFSAKESVYKVWYPLTRRWLRYAEATVALDQVDATAEGVTGTFRARLLRRPPRPDAEELSGRFLVAGGLILTAIVLCAEERQ